MLAVDLGQNFSADLVCRFYEGIMQTMFPVDEERDTLDFFMDALNPAGAGFGEDCRLHVILVFSDLEKNDSRPELVTIDKVPKHYGLAAAVCFEYYAIPNLTILTYIATLPDFRGRGIGGFLIRMVEKFSNMDAKEFIGDDSSCSAILAETHDREVDDNVMDCSVRHRVLYGWGFRQIMFPYVQPPLCKGQSSATNLLLIAKILPGCKPASPNTMPSFQLRDFFECFWPDEEINDQISRRYYKFAMDALSKQDHITLAPALPWIPAGGSSSTTDR